MNIKKLAEDLGLEEDDYLEILELFAESGRTDLDALEAAVKSNDAEGTVRAAHSIKGASASLGLPALSELAKDIELKAREQDMNGMEARIETLRSQFGLVVKLVRK